MKGTKNKNSAAVALVVIVVAAVAGVAIWRVSGSWGGKYAAVYLRTGDLYFGKVVRFPSFGLKDVYFIQANPQGAQTPLSVQKFSSVFWGPADYLKINRNQVVWMADLDSNGQLAQALNQSPSVQPNAPASVPGPVEQPSAPIAPSGGAGE